MDHKYFGRNFLQIGLHCRNFCKEQQEINAHLFNNVQMTKMNYCTALQYQKGSMARRQLWPINLLELNPIDYSCKK